MLFPSTVSFDLLITAVNNAKNRFPGHKIVILGDDLVDVGPLTMTNMAHSQPGDLDVLDYGKTTFIYASDQDDIGVPFIRHICSNGGKYLPVSNYNPSFFVNLDRTARAVLESEFVTQSEQGFLKLDAGPGDFLNLMQLLSVTAGIAGDYVEIGCFEGSSAGIALRYLTEKRIPRRCYFLDVFSGFDYEAALQSADVIWQGTHGTSGLENVSRRLTAYADDRLGVSVQVIQSNIITDELPSEIKQIALANIDVDLQEAVFASLCKVAPYIPVGGIMIAEDAGHTPLLIGARVAVDDFLLTEGAKGFVPIYMESGQTVFIRVAA